MKPICPKCQSKVQVRKGTYTELTTKVVPRWKTKVKGKLYECRHCGYVRKVND